MRNSLWPIAVILFLFAQSLSAWHAAATGFEPHQHHGKVCALSFHYEHQSSDAASQPVAITASAAVLPNITRLAPSVVADAHIRLSNPRAPPLFS